MQIRRFNDPAAHAAAVQACRLRMRYGGTGDAKEAWDRVLATYRPGRTGTAAIEAAQREHPELWKAYRNWKPAAAPQPKPQPTPEQLLNNEWKAALAERRARGLSAEAALQAVCRERPDLCKARGHEHKR